MRAAVATGGHTGAGVRKEQSEPLSRLSPAKAASAPHDAARARRVGLEQPALPIRAASGEPHTVGRLFPFSFDGLRAG
jgi:hypothetical protein